MTKAQIRAITPEVTQIREAYEARGFLLFPYLRKEKFIVMKVVAVRPGACMTYRVTVYNWEAAKDVDKNTRDLDQLISLDTSQ